MNATLAQPQPQRTSLKAPTPITVAYGDGIGPEIMAATLRILEAAGANLKADVIEVGEPAWAKALRNCSR